MFNTFNHQGNANQTNSEIPPHTTQKSQDQKRSGQETLEGCRERGTLPLLMGLQAGKSTLKINLAVPQKIGHSTSWGPTYTTPGHIARTCSNMQ